MKAKALLLTESTKIRIDAFTADNGEVHLNLRKMYKTKKDDEWKPARQGITVPKDKMAKLVKLIGMVYKDCDDAPKLPKRGGKDD